MAAINLEGQFCCIALLTITAESMLSKRPVLRFCVANGHLFPPLVDFVNNVSVALVEVVIYCRYP